MLATLARLALVPLVLAASALPAAAESVGGAMGVTIRIVDNRAPALASTGSAAVTTASSARARLTQVMNELRAPTTAAGLSRPAAAVFDRIQTSVVVLAGADALVTRDVAAPWIGAATAAPGTRCAL